MFAKQLVLPALSLGLVQGAVLTRYVRSAVLDVLREDYLRTARAKGLRPMPALVRHGLRNAAIPVVTVLGLQLATLLVGAVVVERVFVIPGLGSLLLDAVANRDLLLVQDVVMLLVVAVLVVNFVVDLLYLVIDPRLREERHERAPRPPQLDPAPGAVDRRGRGVNPQPRRRRACSSAGRRHWRWSRSSGRRTTRRWSTRRSRLLGPVGASTGSAPTSSAATSLSQLMVGARTTLFVGVRRGRRRRRDRHAARHPRRHGAAAGSARLIMRGNDLLLAFPALLLAIMFGAVFGASTLTAMVAIGIATVPGFVADRAERARCR